MDSSFLPFVLLSLLSTFLASVSQVMLKKEAMRPHSSWLKEYLNPLVIGAYLLFFITTFIGVYVYKGLPLSLGPILETTAYLYITFFGITIFKEELNRKKMTSLALIIVGIVIYALG